MTQHRSNVETHDQRIATPHGALFVRQWRLHDAGNASPIVLLHDSLGCVALWRDFPEQLALATRRHVIAYDRLGFGRSDPHPGLLSASFIRDEAQEGFRAVREALGIDDFIAFGHSVGGGMAAGCAAAFPQACHALITESAQAFVEDRTLQGIREAQTAFAQPGRIERLGQYHGDKAECVLHAWMDTWLAPAFKDWTLDDSLRDVSCPALALHGDRDEYGSAAHPQRIVDHVRGPATQVLLPDCGHVPHREQAAEVLELVVNWLADVDRRG